MARPDALFSAGSLSDALRGQEQNVTREANAIPADHALARSVEELAAEVVAACRVERLTVHWEAMTVSSRDVQVDVRWDQNRLITDRSQPFNLPGTEISYYIPFTGEADLFKARPSIFTSSPPRGEVQGSELVITEQMAAPVSERLKAELDRMLSAIRGYVGYVNTEVDAFNERLGDAALKAVAARRSKVLADRELVASMGVPLRRRENARPTYATPAVRRKAVVTPAPRGTRAEAPEPTVPPEEYEQILRIVRGMADVLERSPTAFAGANEEAIRTHFLVQLNAQYQGGASGETFNFEGKTDILVRDGGKVVFIAECKFWGGPKVLAGTVDQILRYSSWRDTKTAVFLFNRTKDLSRVLEQIGPTLAKHENFVREIPYGGETDFRFVLRHRDDPSRELTLTILLFEVPA